MKWYVRATITPDDTTKPREFRTRSFEAAASVPTDIATIALVTCGFDTDTAARLIQQDVDLGWVDLDDEDGFDFQLYPTGEQWDITISGSDKAIDWASLIVVRPQYVVMCNGQPVAIRVSRADADRAITKIAERVNQGRGPIPAASFSVVEIFDLG